MPLIVNEQSPVLPVVLGHAKIRFNGESSQDGTDGQINRSGRSESAPSITAFIPRSPLDKAEKLPLSAPVCCGWRAQMISWLCETVNF